MVSDGCGDGFRDWYSEIVGVKPRPLGRRRRFRRRWIARALAVGGSILFVVVGFALSRAG